MEKKECSFMKSVLLHDQSNHGNQSICSECYISTPTKHQKMVTDIEMGYRNVKLELDGLNNA